MILTSQVGIFEKNSDFKLTESELPKRFHNILNLE